MGPVGAIVERHAAELFSASDVLYLPPGLALVASFIALFASDIFRQNGILSEPINS